MGLFGIKKKPVTEDTVTWSPPDSTLPEMDELSLCTSCKFSGKCQFREGCKVYKQTILKRRNKVEEIRGYISKGTKTKSFINSAFGLAWRERIDSSGFAFIRVGHVDGLVANIDVEIKDPQSRTRKKEELGFRVEIPSTISADGNEILDICKFRAEVRRKVNEALSKR